MQAVSMILCRNVLIYFDKPTQLKLFQRMAACSKDGYLMLGHSRITAWSIISSRWATASTSAAGRSLHETGTTPAHQRKPPPSNLDEDLARITINIGGLSPVVSRCYWTRCWVLHRRLSYDPVSGIGGMNHFMLPEELIRRIRRVALRRQRHGTADQSLDEARRRASPLSAKVLRPRAQDSRESRRVPQRNIDFARRFRKRSRFRCYEDVGGYRRGALFHTHTGKVFLKIRNNEAERTAEEEMVYLISLKKQKLDGDVTLF